VNNYIPFVRDLDIDIGANSNGSKLVGNMKFSEHSDTYIFCIATYGGNAGSVISQMSKFT
jgi:hypothetical protein